MLGDSDGVYNMLGVAISGDFEGYRSEGSVVVGAIFVADIFAKRSGYVGRRGYFSVYIFRRYFRLQRLLLLRRVRFLLQCLRKYSVSLSSLS